MKYLCRTKKKPLRKRPRNPVKRGLEPENSMTSYTVSGTPEGDYIELSDRAARNLSYSNLKFYFETRYAHEKASDKTTVEHTDDRPVTSTERRDSRADKGKARVQSNRKAWKSWRKDPKRLPSGYRKGPTRHYLLPEAGNLHEHNQADSEMGSNSRATDSGSKDRR